jgi:uncharacterized protein YggE
MKNYLVILFCLFFSWVAVAGQDSSTKPTPTIRTNGEATVAVKPDRAQIDIGVVTQGTTSQETVEQNSRQLEAVVASLRKLLGAKADIKTSSYTVMPKYRYAPPAEPAITGYMATNVVRVILTDLNLLSKAIDAAGSAGANQVQSLQFLIGNQQAAQSQALNEAAINARRKADQLASAMGVKVVRVLSVTDTTPPSAGLYIQYRREQDSSKLYREWINSSASSFFLPQTLDVRATVTLAVEIAP